MGKAAAPAREVRLTLPPELVEEFGTDEEVSAAMVESYVVDQFRRDRMSSGYCAQVLGITRRDFFAVLAQHNVPYFEADEDEERAEREEIARYEEERGK